MSVSVTVTLDDDTGAYLERVAADQGRTSGEVAAWIITEDISRERSIDLELVTRSHQLPSDRESQRDWRAGVQHERAGA